MATGLIAPTVNPATPSIATTSPYDLTKISQVPTATSLIGTNTTGATPIQTSTAQNTPSNVASVTASPTNVARTITNPETVSGQLNSLLSSDSRYIQSARNSGLETANSRGLINSSLAAGTSEKAAIDAALPIAQGDAGTYANAGQSAQQANQDVNLTGYKSLLDSAQQAENFKQSTQQNAQNIAGNLAIQKQSQDATSQLQTTLKNMDINMNLNTLEATSRDAFTKSVGPIIQQATDAINKINTTPDEQLSADAKATAVNTQQALLQSQLNTMSSLYNYKLAWNTPSVQPGTAANTNVNTATSSNTVKPYGGLANLPRQITG